MTWDPDLDLEHGVLRNRLKITDPEALAAAESNLTALRIAKMALDPIPGSYDVPHLQHVHWFIAGDVYPFAGRLRTVRLGKGGQAFCQPEDIVERAAYDGDPAPLRTLLGERLRRTA